MRFICQQEDFSKSLSIAQKAINSQNTLPILSNVFLQAKDGKLNISATNLEISIQTSLDTDIKEEGKTTVPARILTGWVGFLKKGEIDIKTKENETLHLKTNEDKTDIKGMSADDFPILNEVEKEIVFKVDTKIFKKSINEVIFSCAHSSVRPVLSGVLMISNEKDLRLVATDSYRLSEKIIELKEALNKEVYSIIPARTMIELERVLAGVKDDGELTVTISQNQIMFEIDNIKLTSRLIEGKFPDYKQIIPSESKTKVITEKQDFVLAIKRVGIFAKENNNNIKISFENNKLIITTDVTEIGNEEASIEASIEGEGSRSSLNGQYLLDVLSVINNDQIEIKTMEKLSPIVICGKDQKDFVHIIMPLKM